MRKQVNRGGLKNVTTDMFQLMCEMELVVKRYLIMGRPRGDVKNEILELLKLNETAMPLEEGCS